MQFVSTYLPNVWVVNDDYILNRNKSAAAQIPNDQAESARALVKKTEEWRTKPITAREQNLLRAMQDLPLYDDTADAFKLDILLEDYLQEVCHASAYSRSL